MRVSVIVPAYNEELHIAQCLESLLAQKEEAFEIIVVDNNSIDKTAEIVKKYPVRLLREKRQGITPARNKGFNAALGEVFARTDTDTIVPSDWIFTIKKHFRRDKKLAAVTGPGIYGNRLGKLGVAWFLKMNKFLMGHNMLYGPNYALRRSVWQKVRSEICLDDTKVHEDFDLAMHVGKYGKIIYDSQMIVRTSARRLKRPQSLVGSYLLRWQKTLRAHRGENFSRTFSL